MTLKEAWNEAKVGDKIKNKEHGTTLTKIIGEFPRVNGETVKETLDNILKCHIHRLNLTVIFSNAWHVVKPTIKTGWINIYKNRGYSDIHRTKEDAIKCQGIDVIDTIEIKWIEL